ncbi:MAG: biotin carboxylase N-terminal domain-containing protein [Paracoccaceae bacterium]|nr:biotin carboxylase N-terminal domain-containing protein [Paracoccaceae bacterium]
MSAPIKRLVVANRGEIALRIMRSCRDMGIETVAVFTTADRHAPHVAAADRAVPIGDDSDGGYLAGSRIIAAAREVGADAIHPGYGFLAENADFAQACLDAGLIFVGPAPEVIRLMGDKAAARRLVARAGLPCLPGHDGADQSDKALARAAAEIGYPVMVKPAAGGGGKGMRRVGAPDALPAALSAARAEARAAFGDDRLIIERALHGPRHVEVQIIADSHGKVLHLYERDCSLQRRHQKIIEEAPAPGLTDALRARLCDTAVQIARLAGYENAGTVEFLLEGDDAFHFLEMNTRIQVEHPVTEMVTGIDIVALQIEVAQGAALAIAQADIALQGHAIEARLYAEDSARGFLPSAGRVLRWQPPTGPGIRVDHALAEGGEVSLRHDPMLAKIIAHGMDRQQALGRLHFALGQTVLLGPDCNRDFLRDMLKVPALVSARVTTATVDEMTLRPQELSPDEIAFAAALFHHHAFRRARSLSCGLPDELAGWSNTGQLASRLEIDFGGQVGKLTIKTDGPDLTVRGEGLNAHVERQDDIWRVNGRAVPLLAWQCDGHDLHVATRARQFHVTRLVGTGKSGLQEGQGRVVAPMHGEIVEVVVAQGQKLDKGGRLAVLSAMKMQHDVRAPIAGRVGKVAVRPGQQVAAGDLLFEIEAAG